MTRLGKFCIIHIRSISAIFIKLLRSLLLSFFLPPTKVLSRSLLISVTSMVLFAGLAAPTFAYNILYVTRNNGVINAGEQLRVELITSWGHTITTVHDGDSQSAFDAAIAITDLAYVSEEVASNSLGDKLTAACYGVVTEDPDTVDDLGIATAQSVSFYNSTDIYINDVTHYITQTVAGAGVGSYPIFTETQRLNNLDRTGTVSADAIFRAWEPTDSNSGTLVTMEIGGALVTGGSAPGRRVVLPWGDHQMTESDFVTINANGETIMRRSIEWVAMTSSCSFMQKRSFLTDGTPLADGTQLAAGTEVKFLIYINNKGGAINDVSVQDILDPTFSYVQDSLQIDNSLTACTNSVCTQTEENNIFSAAQSGPSFTDDAPPIDSDGASYDNTGGIETINIGDQNVPGNGQVDINATSVWALLFSVTLN